MARIPFTLETWLKDKSQKVETRDERIVHNIWPVKEPLIVNGKSAEVCALIDGEEDALVFFTGGKYLPVNAESPFDLFLVTPEEEMTEFEKAVGLVFTDAQLIPRDKDGIANIHDIDEFIKKRAAELLALAKKQLLSYDDESNPKIKTMADLERTYFSNPDKLPKWLKDDIARKELNAHTKGYNKGYKDAEKQYNESVAYHFPVMPQNHPFCYEPGGTCTNPQMDCINCPRKTTGGKYYLNTSSGTSTAKAEG